MYYGPKYSGSEASAVYAALVVRGLKPDFYIIMVERKLRRTGKLASISDGLHLKTTNLDFMEEGVCPRTTRKLIMWCNYALGNVGVPSERASLSRPSWVQWLIREDIMKCKASLTSLATSIGHGHRMGTTANVPVFSSQRGPRRN